MKTNATPFQQILDAFKDKRLMDAGSLLSKYSSDLSIAELSRLGIDLEDNITKPSLELVLMSSSQTIDFANLLRSVFAADQTMIRVRDTGFNQWRFVLRQTDSIDKMASNQVIEEEKSIPKIYACLLDASIAYPRMAIESDVDRLEKTLLDLTQEIDESVFHFTQNCAHFLILNTIAVPAQQFDALIDFKSKARAARLWHEFNARLLHLLEKYPRIQVLETRNVLENQQQNQIVNQQQNQTPNGVFWDARMASSASVQWTNLAMLAFAKAYLRTFKALSGQAKKCVSTQLLNKRRFDKLLFKNTD